MAIQTILEIPKYIGIENLFIWYTGQNKARQIKSPRHQFESGRKAAGLEWVTFHRLRHYRVTSWIQYGADIRSVQGKAGHKSIQTTMRYAHYVETHADQAIRDAQEREMSAKTKIETERVKNGGGV